MCGAWAALRDPRAATRTGCLRGKHSRAAARTSPSTCAPPPNGTAEYPPSSPPPDRREGRAPYPRADKTRPTKRSAAQRRRRRVQHLNVVRPQQRALRWRRGTLPLLRCTRRAIGKGSPRADAAGESPVPVQMWAGVSPVPVQMWAGVSPVPVQMWACDWSVWPSLEALRTYAHTRAHKRTHARAHL